MVGIAVASKATDGAMLSEGNAVGFVEGETDGEKDNVGSIDIVGVIVGETDKVGAIDKVGELVGLREGSIVGC